MMYLKVKEVLEEGSEEKGASGSEELEGVFPIPLSPHKPYSPVPPLPPPSYPFTQRKFSD